MTMQPQPTSRYSQLLGYEIHWMDWGPADGEVILAWHGLARTGRDMDALALHFAAKGYRVLCPDTIGRGLSQWSRAPADEYQLSFYAALAEAFCDALALRRLHWVGTSMGGAIGTVCAGGLQSPRMKERIASLVLNDNAPELAEPALARIRAYAGELPVFDTVAELEAFFRQVYAPYGWLSDAQWRGLTESSTRRRDDGRITPHYDPAMVQQFVLHPDDYRIWSHYDAIEAPVLCLRGAVSDLVLPETLPRMQQRGPGQRGLLQLIEVPGCGHAPALNVASQLDAIEAFLRAAAQR